jgi:hypothetical protein
MNTGNPCRCGCRHPGGADAHRIMGTLAIDDVDGAIDGGLLAIDPCPGCSPGCTHALLAARDARRAALAARDRFRARQARLLRRQQERLARRIPASGKDAPATSLPPAAAAALQRALGKAAGRDRT